ncbi:PLP-dependent aminotransferase family protein [Streptomyces sp. NBC_01808]|uniref:MocR-like pyridoxine biosynthesis transcription factor PdxR n=1 Tax=Streptomyces sp. NBC_01808 TaxID=2975947 RepID=UPI002DD9F18B|nr:PLP-dependent aminotransferase family protein [Streptomyces sp. NBC_01808]WSA40003.1 PLP-dependent aminotransferase family protein [Streptomyces sp. NBC_01808]
MADSWATSAELRDFHRSLDLHVDVRAGTRGAGAALVRSLRDAVRTGRLAPGTRLPSSRALAADLGVARNTVADAYAELVAEGWLTARQGSGTRVAARSEPRRATTQAHAPAHEPPRHPLDRQATYNLLPGAPDAARFPRAAWAAAARRALTAAPSAAFGHQGPGGRVELRRALAGYLARARGVYAEPERIVVCAGFTGGLRLLAEVLRAEGARRVAVEPYGLGLHRRLLADAGLRTVPLPYDEEGIATAALPATGAGAVLLTPAHQFPTGVPLAPDRRAAAVDWARATGGVVLDDDYDGEFRYDRQPVGALQSLDPEHVAHLGTVSKSLSPALRLGWMVLPERLVRGVHAVQSLSRTPPGVVDQLTLAEFLDSGGYDRHVRAARQRYRRRRDRLVAELARRAPRVTVTGIAAGLHAVVRLPPGTERRVLARAAGEGLAVARLGAYEYGNAAWEEGGDFTAPAPAGEAPGAQGEALVVGYGTPPDHLYPGALAALCRVLEAET